MKTINISIIFALAIVILALSNIVIAQPDFVVTPIDKAVSEGDAIEFTITSTAADSGTNTFTATEKGSAIGTISQTSTTSANFRWQTDFNSQGVHTVAFTVSDANSSSQKNATFVIADIIPTANISAPTTITIGDQNHRRNDNVTAEVRIANSGTVALTSTDASLSSITDQTLYNVRLEKPATGTVAKADSSSPYRITVQIPNSLDAIDDNFARVQKTIGQISWTATSLYGTATAKSTITVQAQNLLIVPEIKARVNSRGEQITKGDTLTVKPGDKISFEATIRNDFSTSTKIDIQDVTLTVRLDENDLRYTETVNKRRIQSGAEITMSLGRDLEIKPETNAGSYTVFVEAKGTDENGAKHGEQWTFTIDVEKENHAIKFKSLYLTDENIGCLDRTTRMLATIWNLGEEDEDNAAIEIKAPSINYTEKRNGISLRSGRTADEETFLIPIPASFTGGKVEVTARALYDNNAETEVIKKIVNVESCTPKNETATTKTITPGQVVAQPITNGARITRETSATPFTETPTYMAILGGAAVLLSGMVVTLIIKLFKK